MNFRYPVFLDISGKHCLVTGAGFEISAKIQKLVDQGAIVTYVNPVVEDSIAALARNHRITWHAREFIDTDLNGCFLVIADTEHNAHIFELAERCRVLCNAADDPEFCRFSFGSVVSRGDLTMAISTNGIAPALAVRLRQRFEREFGAEYAAFLAMLCEVRGEIAETLPDFEARKALWYELIDSDALFLLQRGRPHEARRLLRSLIDAATRQSRIVE